jgi:glycosyltransferase involved in cell wall biosynthesis
MESISLFFPVYQDENTIRDVAAKSRDALTALCDEFEIIIVDDCSPDRSGEIADELALKYNFVQVIHHPRQLGYGAAIKTGLSACSYDLICMIDGDDEYDVYDLPKLLRHIHHYDLIITFRYKKIYSNFRIFISWSYNKLLRFLFRTPFRDISTGFRLVRRSLIEDIELESDSPFIGAELAIKAMLKGYPVGQVGIQSYPTTFRRGNTVSYKNIKATIADMIKMYRKVFSNAYQ